jgi:thiamine pyrophosphokinase
MKALIIAFGSLRDSQYLINEAASSDVIICADGGLEHAARCGITPDYMIGDFDSVSDKTFEEFKAAGVMFMKYPPEKDYTDTEICIEKAIKLGADEICIAAGIGSRIDHSLGNIGLLHILISQGIKAYIVSDDCIIYMCRNDNLRLKGAIGDIVSILPYGGNAEGITLKGLKYPLDNAVIPLGKPTGISNVMVDKECMININNGEIIIIHYRNV